MTAGTRHEHLSARVDLGDATLARMRDLWIRYDRIGGVFFEIVERRGHDRYGELNASVRLAAQAARDRSDAEIMTAVRA